MRVSRRQSLRTLAATAVWPVSGAERRGTARPVRLFVFDVGGTLIEDRDDVPQALMSALMKHGIAASAEEIAARRGAAKREVVRYFVERHVPRSEDREKLVARIYDEFNAKLIEAYRKVPPIAGAEEAIRRLRDSGYLVAATTGFDRAITASIFRRLGWEDKFAAVICSDDVKRGRPSPYMIFHAMETAGVDSVAEVAVIGDTPLDLQAGVNAGVHAVIGVLSGASTAAKLEQEPHTHILPSVAHVPPLAAKL